MKNHIIQKKIEKFEIKNRKLDKITEENFDWTKHTTDGVYQKMTLDVTKTVTCAYPWGIDDDLRKKTLTSWKSEKDAKDILSDEALTWFSAGNFESYYHQGSSSWKYDSEAEALSQSLSCSGRKRSNVSTGADSRVSPRGCVVCITFAL